jgi:hypothetical protein
MARAIAEHPPAAWAHRVLCPIYLLAGKRTQAQRSVAVVQRLYPVARNIRVRVMLALGYGCGQVRSSRPMIVPVPLMR